MALAGGSIVALGMGSEAQAARSSLHLARVTEDRKGYTPALFFGVTGVAPASRYLLWIDLDSRACARAAFGERARAPSRRLVLHVRGSFEEVERIGDIPRPQWAGHLCAYLERRGGKTVARTERDYRIATYQNPVYPADFPDPMVMVLDLHGRHRDYYAYATGDRFPILRSSNLTGWRFVGRAFSTRPGWVVGAQDWHPWAPSVLEDPRPCRGAATGHCFILYYSGQSAQFGVMCVGVATARSPAGPFTDHGILRQARTGAPIGCKDPRGYSEIDPDPFVDRDGRAFLYVSTGATCQPTGTCQWRPTISVLPLSRDRLHAVGRRLALFSGDPGTWEQAPWGPVVEGPWMVRRGGRYLLFYSGGAWNGRYGMGYATSSSPLGPFVKSPSNPLLTDSATVLSAGGGSLVTGPAGGTWVVYHGRSGSYSAPRTLRIDRVHWGADGHPSIRGPTDTPQAPVP